MKKRAWFVVVLAAFSCLAIEAQAAQYKVDKVHSSVGFSVRHFVSRVHGNFGKFEGSVRFDKKQPRKTRIKASVWIASVATNNAKRDGHLKSKDFFYASKFPRMGFVSQRVTRVRKRGKQLHMDILGTLTIRGISRKVTLKTVFLGEVNAGRMGVRAGFRATATINRFHYKLSYGPRVMLGSDVKIVLNVAAVRSK